MPCRTTTPCSMRRHADAAQPMRSCAYRPMAWSLPCRRAGTEWRSLSGAASRAARKVGPRQPACLPVGIGCGLLLCDGMERTHRLRPPRANLRAERNISWSELAGLVECGLLTSSELSSCIVSSWDSVQVHFHGGQPLNCGGGILDCGISPK